MKNKVVILVVGVLFLAGLILFLKVQGTLEANAQSLSAASNPVLSSSANDVGASAPRIARSNPANSSDLSASNPVLSSSANDVGASAPSIAQSNQANSSDLTANNPVLSSSANDVGASAPWIAQSNPASSSGLTAGGAPVIKLPVTGSSTQLNNIWAILRDQGHQSIGWRDAGAGSRDQ